MCQPGDSDTGQTDACGRLAHSPAPLPGAEDEPSRKGAQGAAAGALSLVLCRLPSLPQACAAPLFWAQPPTAAIAPESRHACL